MEYNAEDQARWAPEPPHDPQRSEFERDRARVLHSSGLRRLGAKTQVLGPASNDFIRTRLTHSLEVAQIGRSLAKYLGADEDLVETACLCHDLGHPPFGHNGESSLGEVMKGAGGFEGNAQTLRIMTRLEPKRFFPDGRSAGMNLTRATIDACVKYPWSAAQAAERGTPKFGYYSDDAPAFWWARVAGEDTDEPEFREGRSVEAQIMDLSDDIAYSVHDVEDAIFRGTVPLARLHLPAEQERLLDETTAWYGGDRDALGAALDRILPSFPREFSGSHRDIATLKDLTSQFIGRFLGAVSHASPPSMRYTGEVVVPADIAADILMFKGIAVTYVMAPRELEPTYFEQRTVLYDLVDALSAQPDVMEPSYVEWYQNADDDEGRLRAVVDQVAALTDLSAMQWHARLCGMLRTYR